MIATPKIKALCAAIATGFTGFLAFISNTPPSQQEGLLGALLAVIPVAARPEVAAIAKLLSEVALAYGIYQASHSGPVTKPVTDPQTGEAATVPVKAEPSPNLTAP